MVDEIFNDYIRRQGFVEPLSAKFCNGTTSTCDGLSQWGSQEMAQCQLPRVPPPSGLFRAQGDGALPLKRQGGHDKKRSSAVCWDRGAPF